MSKIRKSIATVGAAALVIAPVSLLAGSAQADGVERTKEFRVAGAEVDFSVEKDDGRFEVDVDIDDARRGATYRVVLTHDGTTYYNRVLRADGDGDIDVDTARRDTRGTHTFKVRVKKVGGNAATRTIRVR